MMGPLLSVIVPVYKVEQYLDRCLQSITGQTYHNLEIMLVDDGSPDGSGAICDRWAARDSRIRVIHQENRGAGAARNAALDVARGDLIGFVDSDDYLAPQMYAYLYSLMEEDVDISECEIVETEEDSCLLDDGSEAQVYSYCTQEAMKLHIADTWFRQTPPNKLYRARVLEGVRFPVGNLIDDEYVTYRAIGKSRRLVHSTARMYAYRQQSGSAMHKPYSLKRLEGIRAKQERLHYLEEKMPALVPQAKDDLVMSCLYGMQGTLRNLKGEQRHQAEDFLYAALGALKEIPGGTNPGGKRGVLLRCVQRFPKGTARAVNLLEDMKIFR